MTEPNKKRKADYEAAGTGVSVGQVKTWLSGMSRDDAINLIAEMAVKNADILTEVQELINRDPSFTKLFVRSLDWSTTDDSLNSLFSQYGDVQEAVVLKDNLNGKSKGFGFVTFVAAESAQKALVEPRKQLDGREISCHLASEKNTRAPVQQRSYNAPQQPAYGGQAAYGAYGYAQAPQPSWTSSTPGSRPPAGATADRRLFVRSLAWETTTESLKAHFEQFGGISECAVVSDRATGRSKGFGFVTFADPQSAINALAQPEKYIDGRQTSCSLAADRDKAPGAGGAPTMASGMGAGMAVPQQMQAMGAHGMDPAYGAMGGVAPGMDPNMYGAMGMQQVGIQQTLHDLQQQQVNLQQRLVQQQQQQHLQQPQQAVQQPAAQQPQAYY